MFSLESKIIDSVSVLEKTRARIQTHLSFLLNTRRGSLSYLPDYGMPDLNEIYQSLPESIDDLVQLLEGVIEKYEPRLKRLEIIPYPSDAMDCVIYLKLYAQYEADRDIHFDTYFLSGGAAKIDLLTEE